MKAKRSNKILAGAGIALLIVATGYVVHQRNQLPPGTGFSGFFGASKQVQGDGEMQTIQKNLKAFTSLDVGGNFVVTIKTGKPHMNLTIDKNLLPDLKIVNDNNQLIVKNKPGINIHPSKPGTLIVTVPKLTAISVGGNTTLHAQDLNSDQLNLTVGGNTRGAIVGTIGSLKISAGGNTSMAVTDKNAKEILLGLGGSTSLNLQGKTDSLTIRAGGSTNINAKNLLAKNVKISAAGSTTADVYATDALNVSGVGSGVINYYGNPKELNKTIVGHVVLNKML